MHEHRIRYTSLVRKSVCRCHVLSGRRYQGICFEPVPEVGTSELGLPSNARRAATDTWMEYPHRTWANHPCTQNSGGAATQSLGEAPTRNLGGTPTYMQVRARPCFILCSKSASIVYNVLVGSHSSVYNRPRNKRSKKGVRMVVGGRWADNEATNFSMLRALRRARTNGGKKMRLVFLFIVGMAHRPVISRLSRAIAAN